LKASLEGHFRLGLMKPYMEKSRLTRIHKRLQNSSKYNVEDHNGTQIYSHTVAWVV